MFEYLSEAQAIKAFTIGVVSAISLMFGAIASFYWRPGDRTIAFMMALGGGALLAALSIDLVGEALHRGHYYSLCFGCLLGGILFIVLDKVVEDYGGFKRKVSTTIYHVRKQKHRQYKQILSGIERTDIFKHLQVRHFKQISNSIKSHEYKKGDIIYHPGDPSEEMLVALSGEVELFYPEKDKRPSRTVGTNQAFGLHAFLTGAPHSSGAAVRSDTAVLMVPRIAFNSLLLNSTTLQQVMHRWIRSHDLTSYLKSDQKMTVGEAREWLDHAAQTLISKGNIPPALKPIRHSEEFIEIVDEISRTSLFHNLPPNEIELISQKLLSKHFEEGQTLFHQNDLADRMFVLEAGEVSLIDKGASAGEDRRFKSYDAIGCHSFVCGAKHSVSAVATRACRVWVLRREEFRELIDATQVFREQVERLVSSNEIKTYLATKQHLDQDAIEKYQVGFSKALSRGQSLPVCRGAANNSHSHGGAGLAIWLGILLDGIPESLVIGSSMINSTVSISLLVGLFIANFPESLSSSLGMRKEGFSNSRILTMWGSIVLITGMGAAFGNIFFAGAEPFIFALVEGVAAGAMLTMIAQTMLPEAYFKGGSIVGFATLLGFIAAILSKTLE